MHLRVSILLLPLWLPAVAVAGAATLGSPQRLDPLATGDGAIADQFGRGLAVDGTTLAVGARQLVVPSPQAAEGVQSGAVFVYQDTGGVLVSVQRVLSPAPAEGDLFGEALAVSSELLAVGAPGADGPGATDRGSLHVFRRSGGAFVHEVELLPPQATADQRFGSAVAILDATTIVVGMPGDSVAGTTASGRVLVFRRLAASWTAVATLQSPDAAAGDDFGAALAVQGDRLLVGAPRVDAVGGIIDAGAVEVFDTTAGFAWLGRLAEAQPAANARFGSALWLDAAHAIVGASGNLSGNRGFARVFTRSGGVFAPAERLEGGDGVAADGFGFALARSGDTLLVGAPGRFFGDGGAHVFVRTGGTFVERALLQDRSVPEGGGVTGVAVALIGGRALLGADQAIVLPNRAQGAVRIWSGADATWTAQQRLDRGDGVAGEFFGTALSVDATRLAVGAFLDDTEFGGDDAGTVSVFARGDAGWARTQRLVAQDGQPEDWFGRSVALAGDWLVVGAPRDITSGVFDTGSAYVFRRLGGNWVQQRKLVPADVQADDAFGLSIAFDGRRLLIAAPGHDSEAADRGAAYAWTLLPDGVLRFDGKLVPVAVPAEGLAGIAMALRGDTLLMGAPQATVQGRAGRGMLARFDWNGSAWVEGAPVIAADGATGDLFGVALAFSPDGAFLAVGAQGARIDAMNPNAGKAYVYRFDGAFAEQAQLLPAVREADARFGTAVAFDAGRLAVGASGEDTGGIANRGRVHLWRREADAWVAAGTVEPADAVAQSAFGRALAGDFGVLAVGGPLRPTAVNPAAGAVWVYPDADALFADGIE